MLIESHHRKFPTNWIFKRYKYIWSQIYSYQCILGEWSIESVSIQQLFDAHRPSVLNLMKYYWNVSYLSQWEFKLIYSHYRKKSLGYSRMWPIQANKNITLINALLLTLFARELSDVRKLLISKWVRSTIFNMLSYVARFYCLSNLIVVLSRTKIWFSAVCLDCRQQSNLHQNLVIVEHCGSLMKRWLASTIVDTCANRPNLNNNSDV